MEIWILNLIVLIKFGFGVFLFRLFQSLNFLRAYVKKNT
jgi:hypothetical protein